MSEVWRPVRGYEGEYEVSDSGRVRSLSRPIVGIPGRRAWMSRERVLYQSVDKAGYVRVNLTHDGIRKGKLVHVLVAEAFMDRPNGKTEVNHINGIKGDNRICNLEFCTPSENIRHAIQTGLRKAKSTPVYCEDGRRFSGAAEASKVTLIGMSSICKCCKGRIKKAGGLRWSYEPFGGEGHN